MSCLWKMAVVQLFNRLSLSSVPRSDACGCAVPVLRRLLRSAGVISHQTSRSAAVRHVIPRTLTALRPQPAHYGLSHASGVSEASACSGRHVRFRKVS